jgi:insulysin
MDILKSKEDKRKMKYFELKNKLRYICVEDKEIDKSYLAVSINVGSLVNKQYYEGIAHLLEHMCFITSSKYKIKNHLQNKATELGGYTNAYTDDINTVYYFEIFSKNLDEIVEIFADYLFNSDIDQQFVMDEMKNVDSEHNKNINNDGFRIYNVEHLLTDSSSEYNSFFTGSINTLNKSDIRDKLVDLYKKYYVPENISLCIVSNLEIEKINKIIIKNFNNIKNNKIHYQVKITKPIYKKNINKAFLINSVNKTYTLKYIFESLELNKYNKSKIFSYVSILINTKMKNSLNDFLKINNYISELYAYFDTNSGLFYIIFELTKYGYKNIIKVDGYLKYYIDYILKCDFKKIYDIYNTIAEFNFNNNVKDDSMDLAQTLAINCYKYDTENIYKGDLFILEYNEKHIKDLHKILNFDNTIQLIITDKFNEKKYMVDSHYGTKYKEIKKINSKLIKFHIELDFNNDYIGDKIIFYKNLKNEKPIEINKNMWFGNTSKFNEKVNYVCIIFSKKDFFNSPKHLIYTNISLIIINFLLNRELYNALKVNYNFSFSMNRTQNEILLGINLINDKKKSQKFIDNILDFILSGNIELNNKFILQVIKNYELDIKNIKNMSPWDYVNYIENLNYKNFYHYDLILKELKNIKICDFIFYYKNLFNNTKCITYTYGNIDTNYDFNKIKHLLHNNYTFNKLVLSKLVNITHPNKKEINNCIKILIKVGKYNTILALHLYLTTLIIKDIFYNILRTEKQLGYLVSFSWVKIDDDYYFSEKIQSSHNLEYVQQNIIDFNKNILCHIKDIDFNMWIENLKLHLESKDNSIYEVYNRYYIEITNREFNFNRNEQLLMDIKKITKKSLIDFIDKYIVKNKKIFISNIHAHKQK